MKKIILFVLVFVLLSSFVAADLGPKPTAYFHMTYEGREITPFEFDAEFSAQMLTCQEHSEGPYLDNIAPQLRISEYDSSKRCYWEPAQFAWGGGCSGSACKFTYFLPEEFKLAVYLPSKDQVFTSDVLVRKSFESSYEANLMSNGGITIKDVTPFSQSTTWIKIKTFFLALFLTLIFELVAAFVFVLISKDSKKVLLWVFLGNLISLPIVWFVFPIFKIFGLVILFAEIFAVVFEAYFVHYLSKKTFSLKKSFLLSVIMNLASFLLGGFVFIFITKFLLLF